MMIILIIGAKEKYSAGSLKKMFRSDIASYSMGGIDESIGKLPLKTVPITGLSSNYISFADNNIQVTINGGVFDPSKHKLGYYDAKYLVKIDNKPYFGNYGKVPNTTIQSVTVVIDNDTVPIPPAAFSDLYNPVFSVVDGGVLKSNNKVYLSADRQESICVHAKAGVRRQLRSNMGDSG
ncbi:MAG: hypothetical protein WKG06_40940 [Segetibacter sp.]